MSTIRTIQSRDVQSLIDTFTHQDDDYFSSMYIDHLQEKCIVFVASDKDEDEQRHYHGYVRLLWESNYTQFWRRNIPEITDLYVAKTSRKQGIGRALISACEELVDDKGYNRIGISVTQAENSMDLHALYEKLGYGDEFGISVEDNQRHFVKNL